MLRCHLSQLSMFDVNPDEIGLEEDSFERHLPYILPRLVPSEELNELYVKGMGSPGSCPYQLLAMLLLKFRENLSERKLMKRCRRDLGFRFAIGLAAGEQPSSPRTLRRFRRKLFSVKGDNYLLNLSLRLAQMEQLIDDIDVQSVDSTNSNCRGAVIDTYNLIATAIGTLIRKVAKYVDESAESLADKWQLSVYLHRSIKGPVGIDWDDKKARDQLVTKEIQDADRLVEEVRTLGKRIHLPDEIYETLELLVEVAIQDVEELDDGTFHIFHGTAKDRVISITDPEARHGRKSQSKVINGYKTHVIGTIKSEFVTGIQVTDAGVHDSEPTVGLLRQTEANGVKPKEVVGDGAYGTGANIRACKQEGVALHTKPGRPASKGSIPKQKFDIDVEKMTVTCPQGQSTKHFTEVRADGCDTKVPMFHFERDICQKCDLSQECSANTRNGGKRTIKFSPYEKELQANRAFSSTAHGKQLLRERSSIERLISHLIRLGMRQARFFSLAKVQMQAYLVAAVHNIQRIITLKVKHMIA